MNKSLFAKIFFAVGILALGTLVYIALTIDLGDRQKIYNFAVIANIFTAFGVTSLLVLVSAKEMD
jgi:hypothetical protein